MRSKRPAVIYLFLIFFMLGIFIIHGEPEPMARPTRPEVFTSPEELRKYLDHVRDYYKISGKARYGKRGNMPFSASDVNHAWDTVEMILDVSQPSQIRRKFEERKLLREVDDTSDRKYGSRIGDIGLATC